VTLAFPAAAWAAGPRVYLHTEEGPATPSGMEARLVDRLTSDGFVVLRDASLPKGTLTPGTPAKSLATPEGLAKLGGIADFVVVAEVSGKDEERTAFGVKVFAFPATARVRVLSVVAPGPPTLLDSSADRPATDAGAARAASYRILADAVYPALRTTLVGGPVAKVLHLDVVGLPGRLATDALLEALSRLAGVKLARVRFADAARTRLDVEVAEAVTPAALSDALRAAASVGLDVVKVGKDEVAARWTKLDAGALPVAVGRFTTGASIVAGAAFAAPLLPEAVRIALRDSVYVRVVGGDAYDKAFAAGAGWLGALQAAGAVVAVTGTIDYKLVPGADHDGGVSPDELELVATVWDCRGAMAVGTVRVTVPSWAVLSGVPTLAAAIEEAVHSKGGTIAPGTWHEGAPFVASQALRAAAAAGAAKVKLALDHLDGPPPSLALRSPAGAKAAPGAPLDLYPSFAAWHADHPAMDAWVKNLGGGASGEVLVRLVVEGLGAVAEGTVPTIAPGKTGKASLRYVVDPDALAKRAGSRASVLPARLEITWAGVPGGFKKGKAAAGAGASAAPMLAVALPFVLRSRNDRPTESAAAFVTPRDPLVAAFARAAAEGAEADPALARLDPALRKAAALWDALAAAGVGVHAPKARDDSSRRLAPVRLPAETLVAREGSDLDVAVLYAALAEAAGLRAHLVYGAVAWDAGAAGAPLASTRASVTVAIEVGPAAVRDRIGAGAYSVEVDRRGHAVVPLDVRKLAEGFDAAWRSGLSALWHPAVDEKTGALETEWLAAAWGDVPPLAVAAGAAAAGLGAAAAPSFDRPRRAKLDRALADAWGAARDKRLAALAAAVEKKFPSGDPDPDYLVALGRVAGEGGDLARADDLFKRALALRAAHLGAALGLARTALARGDYDAALEGATKVSAAASGPVRAEAMLVAGLAQAAKGDAALARKLLAGWRDAASLKELSGWLGLGSADPVAAGPRRDPALKGAAAAATDRGLKAFAAGNAAAATAELRAALEAAMGLGRAAGADAAAAAAAFNLAHALWLGGDLAGAAHYFRAYLWWRSATPAPDAEEVERVARALEAAPAGGGAYVREVWSRPSVLLTPAAVAALPW
jgi:hypothetical protein